MDADILSWIVRQVEFNTFAWSFLVSNTES